MVASIIVVVVAAITAAAFGGASFVAAFSCSPYFASMRPTPPTTTATAKIQIRPHLARPSRPTDSSPLAGSFHDGDEKADYNDKRLADDTAASANPPPFHQKTTRGTMPSLGSPIKVSQQRNGTLL